MKNERNSNLELLRIISIIMIIILHYFNFGGFIKTLKGGEVNYYIVHILESACIIAVNIFVLISAYFLSVKSVPKISKVIRLQFLAYFYGGILFLASILFFHNNIYSSFCLYPHFKIFSFSNISFKSSILEI